MMHLGTPTRLTDQGDDARAARYFRTGLVLVLLTAGPTMVIGFVKQEISETLVADVTGLYVGLALFFGLRRSRAVCRAPLLFLGLASYSLHLFRPRLLLPVLKVAPDLPHPAALLLLVTVPPLGGVMLALIVQRWIKMPFNALGKLPRRQHFTLE